MQCSHFTVCINNRFEYYHSFNEVVDVISRFHDGDMLMVDSIQAFNSVSNLVSVISFFQTQLENPMFISSNEQILNFKGEIRRDLFNLLLKLKEKEKHLIKKIAQDEEQGGLIEKSSIKSLSEILRVTR